MTDHANIVRERVSHIARGCRAGTSHNPAVYENDINAALDALVARIRELETEMLDKNRLAVEAQAERDEARRVVPMSWRTAISRAEAAEESNARLREALIDYMASCPANPDDFVQDVAAQNARAALANEETT